ncbi:MAG TPA: thermonuclease family protein [Afifellaceae bacterium]|nr:thermonuclease family protein [Afifellaceae bacterium]
MVTLAPAIAGAAETLPGPYRAQVERVVDGDTLAVRVAVWLGQELSVSVRIRGIDAPERRARCPRERELAEAAAGHLAALVGGEPVALTQIAGGKFYGRVVADVASAAGGDLALEQLAAGLARSYDGGRRDGWCEDEGAAATAAR